MRVVVRVAVMRVLVLELVGNRMLLVLLAGLVVVLLLLLVPGPGGVRRRSWRGVGAAGAGERLQRQREGQVGRAIRVEARGGERRRLRLEHVGPLPVSSFFPLVFFLLFL